jgi:uncharacterized membrane protein YraQ (UPF0718 family)
MTVLIVTLLLYGILGTLMILAWRKGGGMLRLAAFETQGEFLRLMPRLMVGVIGSGFIARALPQDIVIAWLGPASGNPGILIACLAGALTPGGPVVGFAIGAAALKAGAGMPQIMAFVTAWSLYTLNRVLIWELPIMPRQFVWMRAVISLLFPLLAAYIAAIWLGHKI